MARLEVLKKGAQIKGILPLGPVTAMGDHWHGTDVVELTYKAPVGKPHNELIEMRSRVQQMRVLPPTPPSVGRLSRLPLQPLPSALRISPLLPRRPA